MALTDPPPRIRTVPNPRLGGAVSDFFAALLSTRKSLATPVFIYLLAILLPLQTQIGGLFLTSARVVLLIMVLPMLYGLVTGRYGRILLIDILFLLHVVWMAVALAVNNPDRVISNAGSTGIEFIGGYLMGRAFIRTRQDFLALIRLLGMAALCLFPFVLIEMLTGNPLILSSLRWFPGMSTLRDIEIGERMGLNRVQLVFAHPIHSGLFFAILFPLIFVGMKAIWNDFLRVATTLVVVISGFAALSSGALLAMMMQFGLMLWAFVFRGTKRRWFLLLGGCVLAYVTVDLLSNRTPYRVFLTYATFNPATAFFRSLIFDYGMLNVWANPIFGIGLNDWVRASYMYTSSVDNFWLLVAMQYGIPGFTFLAVGYALGLWQAMRRDFDADPVLWQFRRAWVFAFVGMSFTLSTVHVWHSMYSLVFFFFGAGMWMLTVQPETRTAADPALAEPSERSGARYSRFARHHSRRSISARVSEPETRSIPDVSRALSDRQQLLGNAAPARHAPARDRDPHARTRRPPD